MRAKTMKSGERREKFQVLSRVPRGALGGLGETIRQLVSFAFLALFVGLSTACATTQAAVPKDRPALDVPPPPPRVIIPLPAEPVPDLPALEPVDLPAGSPTTLAKPRPPRDRETAKPEAKPEEIKPPEPAPPVVPPPAPVPPLRIPEAGDSGQVAGQVKEIIDRTRRTLDGIDYRTLSKLRQKAYDDAKLFATQAEEALKANNVVFAKELADKAERLAKELQTR